MQGLISLQTCRKNVADLAKFAFVVRVEEKVFSETVIEEVGLLAGTEPDFGFTFFETHGSGVEVACS